MSESDNIIVPIQAHDVMAAFDPGRYGIKVLFIGDPHFKTKNVECIPLFISKVTTVAQTTSPDFIVLAGDLLDNHDKIDVEPLNLALKFIDALSQKSQLFVLVGNHDYKNNQQFLSDNHWMNALKQWNNVTIVDNVVEYEVKEAKFLFLPYVPPGRFMEAITTKIASEEIIKFQSIFGHQEFYGCKMGAIESKHGDKWNEDWPLVISGHIHDKQWSQENIYYPGSAMQHAFGQSSENTISVISFAPAAHNEGHPDIMHEVTCEEIDLGMPKLTIRYLNVSDAMKPLSFQNKEHRRYKIVIQGTQEEFKAFKKNARYKQLLDDGFKVTFKTKNLNIIKETCIEQPKKKFIDILQDKVKKENDPDLELIYHSFV